MRDLKRYRRDWDDLQDQLYRLLESSVNEGILGDDLSEVVQPLRDAIADIVEKVERAESTVTIVEAMEYMVPIPDSDDDLAWQRPPNAATYLNMDAQAKLRATS